MHQTSRRNHPPSRHSLIAAAALAVGTAHAAEINVGNNDFKVRFDTTVRYNLGIRAEDCDTNICGNGAGAGDVTAYQSDKKFSKAGDIVTNRIDILPEFDVIYKDSFGIRLSGAGWYDNAYKGRLIGDSALDASGAGQGAGASGGSYSNYTRKWDYRGAELLDAFAFAKFTLGDVPTSVKIGQHNIYWGESLFSFVGGVAYGQGPVDIRKALATPGVEAKEVFKPLDQISFASEITDRISLAGQYFLDWKPSTLPDGGTYFGAADGLSEGSSGSVFGIPWGGITAKPRQRHGDWGFALKLRPEWLDGTAGFYFREYTDKLPQLVISRGGLVSGNGAPTFVPQQFGLDYTNPKAKMLGFSLSKQVADVSVGMDLTYRKDAMLSAHPFATPAGQSSFGAGPLGNTNLPTGNVIAGVLNSIAYFSKSALFDAAVLTAELNFSHLDKVTHGAAFYNAQDYDCGHTSGFPYGCATRNQVGIAAAFAPTWYQVRDGVDLSLPMFLGVGVYGNSPVPFGDNQGQGSYSIGPSADVHSKYTFSLKYNGYIARHNNDGAGAESNSNASLGKYWDRGWVSFTAKATF